ncbi:cytochrome P450 [Rhypophila decipiens]|uniref:Cytochrome P450 n=1 Tax=Rhypophila decipiens TaxID=261697 RepID=A0AAN6Y6E0_9PEZI|nr:cytochrome P450 [Rhypophila decipiens]
MESLTGSLEAYLGAVRNVVVSVDLRSAIAALLVVPISSILVWFTVAWLTSPLRQYPGPFFAAWTNLWRFFLIQTGENYQLTIKKLHQKYGPVLRIGPNLLDIDYPELIKTIYSTDGKWLKTEFYHNNSTIIDGKITYHMFSTTDQVEHARMKRPIAKYYSIGSVLALEPTMDVVVNDFCKQLEKRFMTGPSGPKECDLGEWIAYYTWDFLASVTFSRPFGYLQKGHDFDRSIQTADKTLDYFMAVSQMPWLDYWLDKNPVVRVGPPNLVHVTRVAFESLVSRLQGKDANFDAKKPDYLQYFIESKETHPDLVNDTTVMGYIMINLIAGADTTAITIRSVFYYCLRNPAVYRKLEAEVLAAGIDLEKPAPYGVSRQLPYLDAVIREALRLHPVTAATMERYVPEGGLVLPDGSVVPAGTAIGMNSYIVGKNKGVYGEDADEFRPERWLRVDGEDSEAHRLRLQRMNAADLSFGGGSRICLGRLLALCEVYKVVATLVRRYEIELVDPTKKWTIEGVWFARQRGILANMKPRK